MDRGEDLDVALLSFAARSATARCACARPCPSGTTTTRRARRAEPTSAALSSGRCGRRHRRRHRASRGAEAAEEHVADPAVHRLGDLLREDRADAPTSILATISAVLSSATPAAAALRPVTVQGRDHDGHVCAADPAPGDPEHAGGDQQQPEQDLGVGPGDDDHRQHERHRGEADVYDRQRARGEAAPPPGQPLELGLVMSQPDELSRSDHRARHPPGSAPQRYPVGLAKLDEAHQRDCTSPLTPTRCPVPTAAIAPTPRSAPRGRSLPRQLRRQQPRRGPGRRPAARSASRTGAVAMPAALPATCGAPRCACRDDVQAAAEECGADDVEQVDRVGAGDFGLGLGLAWPRACGSAPAEHPVGDDDPPTTLIVPSTILMMRMTWLRNRRRGRSLRIAPSRTMPCTAFAWT